MRLARAQAAARSLRLEAEPRLDQDASTKVSVEKNSLAACCLWLAAFPLALPDVADKN